MRRNDKDTFRKKGKGRNSKADPRQSEKRNRRGKFDESDREVDTKSGATVRNMQSCADNDPAWYAVNDQLLRDSASFPYSWPVGNRLTQIVQDTGAGRNAGVEQSIPGVLSLYLSPTIGWADSSESPVNVASRNIYSFVRHANSGHANYDAPDLMLYLLAMDSCYSYHSFLRRLYGVMMDYTPINRYYPRAVVASMNVDFDDAMAHLAQLRYFINQFAVKLGSMCVPNSMSYMVRHMWMYSQIFVDSMSAKAQTYVYNPHAFYKFGLVNDAGALLYTTYADQGSGDGGRMTVQDLIDYGNQLMVPILQNEDMNIMSGDILKAYGADGVIKIMGVSEDFQVLPVFSEEVMSQFQNATNVGYFNSANINNANDIIQATGVGEGYLIHKPTVVRSIHGFNASTISAYSTPWEFDRLISLRKQEVTPADTMVATRLTNIGENPAVITSGVNAGYSSVELHTAGSEICHSMVVYYYGDVGSGWALQSSPFIFVGDELLFADYMSEEEVNVNQRRETLNDVYDSQLQHALTVAMLSVFERHPIMYPSMVMISWDPTPSYQYSSSSVYFYDVDNYTTLSKHDLERMAETALLSQFSVPQMGKFSQKLS